MIVFKVLAIAIFGANCGFAFLLGDMTEMFAWAFAAIFSGILAVREFAEEARRA